MNDLTTRRLKKEMEKAEDDLYFVIVGPVISARALLRFHKYDPDINLATVIRNHSWAWSTFEYSGGLLTAQHRKTLLANLEGLRQEIDDFDWESAKHTRDYYTEAAELYEKEMGTEI